MLGLKCQAFLSLVPRNSLVFHLALRQTEHLRPITLDCQEILAGRSQYLTTALADGHHILDPHTPFAGEVYSRLDSDDHPRLQNLFLPFRDPGSLVNLQPYSVPGRMRKISR